MRAQHDFGSALLIGLVVLGLACDGTMNTGTAKKPVNNKPAADGTCPSGQSLCGVGVFAICVELQDDPGYCGTCDRACSPGIACQSGVCQQTVCTGTAIPLSGQPTTSAADAGVVTYGMDFMPNQVLADINGDGRLDRIDWLTLLGICETCSVDLSTFHVSLGRPDGSFAPPDTYNASDVISRVIVTDVNSDGLADLYVVSMTYTNSTNDPYHVELWLGQKDGHLRRFDAASMTVDSPGGFASEVAIGDLSGDGWPDLVISAPTDPNDPPKLNVYLSDSTGALHLSQTFQAWSLHTVIRDWNGDGSPDLALVSGSMEILYNRGDGTFEPPLDCALYVGGGSVQSEDLLVEDFNRDGWMDIASEDMFTPRVGVMLGLGGCGFSPISYYDLPGNSAGFLRAADINGDGILDIVSVNGNFGPPPSNSISATPATRDYLLAVLIGHSDGTFQLQNEGISLGPNVVTDVTIGEVTGDQRPDIVVSSTDGKTGQTSTWENTCQ